MGARHRDRLFLALASLALLAVVATGGYFWKSSRPAVKKAETPKQAEPPVESAPTGIELTFSGPVQARNVVPVPAPMDGTLETVEVEEGEEVGEEQLLARVKNEGIEAARQRAQEELDQMQSRVQNLESSLISARLESSRASADAQRAQAEFERLDKAAIRQQLLHKEGATPRLVYEKAQKDLELATSERDSLREAARSAQERIGFLQKDLDNAKRRLDERTQEYEEAKSGAMAAEIRSPVDGVVVSVKAKAGDQVSADMQDLMLLAVAPEELEVLIDVDEKVAAKIPDGTVVAIQVLEVTQDFEGKVTRDEDGKLHVEFESGDVTVKPGLNAVVKIKLP